MGYSFSAEDCEFFASETFARLCAARERMQSKYSSPLTLQTKLRAEFPDLDAARIRACSAQIELRDRARRRLGMHPDSLVAAPAVEQASSTSAARLHASFFAGKRRVCDLCAGIGSDAVRIAPRVESLVCVEADPVVARMLQRNLHLADCGNATVFSGTVERWLPDFRMEAFDAVFADPSRRRGGARATRAEDYCPPLSFFRSLAEKLPVTVKVSPAADIENGFWQKMFVAAGQECAELLLFRGFNVPLLSVIDADSGASWTTPAVAVPIPAVDAPRWLIEPHNAIVRSGRVAGYLASIGAAPVDPRIAYGLSAASPPPSIWHRTFEIVDSFPFNKKRLQAELRAHSCAPTSEIKKRGFPLLPEEIRKLFRFEGVNEYTLIFTRRGDEHHVFITRRA